MDYLTWYKARLNRLYQNPTEISLLNSSVQPSDVLRNMGSINVDMLRRRNQIPNPFGHPNLVQTISQQTRVDPDRILLTQGATQGIYLICSTLIKPSDHVIVESPGYEPLWLTPRLFGAQVTFWERTSDIAPLILKNTRCVFITNLHNPSGRLLDDAALADLIHQIHALNPKVCVVVDEIYKDFVPGFHSPASSIDSFVISITSLTKVYGLDYLRCGWMIADPNLIQQMSRRQMFVTGIGSRLLEAWSSMIMEQRDDLRNRSINLVRRNRNILNDYMAPLMDANIIEGYIPEFGCVYFPQVSGLKDTFRLTASLADNYGVHVVPGMFFNDPKCIRIGFGGDTEPVREGISRFVEAMKILKP